MTDLAKLVVRLEAQSAQLLTELDKANRKIDRFAAQTTKTLNKWAGNLLGAFSARAMVQFGAQVLKTQGDLVDMAMVANTTVEDLSALGYAASQSGSDLETLNKGLANIGKNAAEAQKGSKGAAEAFGVLGIDVEDANGGLKDSSDLLLEVAEQFAQYEDGAAKAALAQDLFGKQGRDLIPLLNKGADGIEALTKRAEELGIVVSTEAAQAASQFNDQMDTLAKITQGVVGEALAEITPILNTFTESLFEGAAGSERLDQAARILAAGLKLLLSAGVIVGEIFDRIGDAVGAAAAAVVAVAQGEFRRAWDIMSANSEEAEASAQQAADDLYTIWADAGNRIAKNAEDTDARVKKTLIFGGDASGLQEVKINLEKIDLGPMEALEKELNDLTKTGREKALESFYAQKAALDQLNLPAETYAARLAEINKALEDGLGITERQEAAAERQKRVMDEGRAVFEATRTPLERYEAEIVKLNLLIQQGAIDQETYNRAVEQAQDAFDKATDGAAAFYEEAKENAQDILGQGIYDSIKSGFDRGAAEALDTFADMLLRMATEALAADIFGALFKTDGTSSSGGGGGNWLNQAASVIGGFFGGGRAMEGPVNPGVSYMVGENGPERFVPDRPGRVEDARRWGGSRNNIYVTVEAPKGTVSRQTQLQTGATVAKQIGHANRRNN